MEGGGLWSGGSPLSSPRPTENQVKDFFGESLPPGAKLWSKEGDTSEVRHAAAYIELSSGRKLVVAILTRGAADEKRCCRRSANTYSPSLARIEK